jgi:ribonuclease D
MITGKGQRGSGPPCVLVGASHNTIMTKAALKLPRSPQGLTETPGALAEVCHHLRAAKVFGFDTEWDPRPSYRPRLCLVQVATDERVELIDPRALDDLGPFWDLLADPAVEKICHAADQDLAIAWRLGRKRPQNVFDCQVGAGLVGIGHQEAYSRLVEIVTGDELVKKATRSEWHERPLEDSQLIYAVDDVKYLLEIYRVLQERLDSLQRMAWMREACDGMCVKAATDVDPMMVFADMGGAPKLQPWQQSVLRELAALREQVAYERDLPVRWVFEDKALLSLAVRGPDTVAHFRGNVPQKVADEYGPRIIGAIRRGKELPPDQQPCLTPPIEDSTETKRLADIMYASSQVICLGQSVSPGVVANKKEIEGLARLMSQGKDLSGHALMNGWTRECLGALLVEFVRGETDVTLRVTPERMYAEFEPRG